MGPLVPLACHSTRRELALKVGRHLVEILADEQRDLGSALHLGAALGEPGGSRGRGQGRVMSQPEDHEPVDGLQLEPVQ